MKIINNLNDILINYVSSVGLIIFLNGCNLPYTKMENSKVLHEPAVVSETVRSPSRHDTEIELKALNMSGRGFGSIGMDYGGNMGIGIGGGLQISSSKVPEKYGVVFKCQHGKFISEGSDNRHKDLWSRLSEGDSVDVNYMEIYQTTYQDSNKDGTDDIIKRVLIGYDFLDARVTRKASDK